MIDEAERRILEQILTSSSEDRKRELRVEAVSNAVGRFLGRAFIVGLVVTALIVLFDAPTWGWVAVGWLTWIGVGR